jgi:hypothetical protein
MAMQAMASSTQDEFSSFTSKDGMLHAAVLEGDNLFSMFTGTAANMGKDAATGYTAAWVTPWLLPNSGMLAQLQRARVQGSNGNNLTLNIDLYKDLELLEPRCVRHLGVASTRKRRASRRRYPSARPRDAFAFAFAGGGESGSGTDLSIRALHLITTELQWPSPGYPRPRATDSGGPPPGPLR